ncbi:hypothetical protein [Catenovulum sediminis]|nr:hypothetical protein [Catenovulum sediminis]
MRRFKSSLAMPVLLLCGLMINKMANAGLINQDFSSGFSNWHGEVVVYNFTSDSDTLDFGDIAGSYPENFETSSNTVTLNTSFDIDNDYWSIVLFQDFTVDNITAGNNLTLALDVSYRLTDDVFDFVFVQLFDLDNNLSTIDLTAGGRFDLTAWSGANASIQFGVIDGDFDLFDSLTVANLSITETVADIPEPAALFIFIGGLILLVVRLTLRVHLPRMIQVGV